jgi:ankyrin repeat protein
MFIYNYRRSLTAIIAIVLTILTCNCGSIRNKRLVEAVEKGDVTVVRDLLVRGAEPRALAADGTTPLLVRAASIGRTEIVEELLKAGAPIDSHFSTGDTPLLAAARASNSATVKLLCERGANLAYSSGQGETPLLAVIAQIAASKEDSAPAAETLRILLSRKPDINVRNAKGQTPLMLAAAGSSSQVTAQLLTAGARLDETDNEGRTAIMLAAAAGNDETVENLRDLSAKTDLRDKQGHTAADIARSAGHIEIASDLEATFQDGRWTGKTSAGTSLSFVVSKGRLVGVFHLTFPGNKEIEQMDIDFAQIDREKAESRSSGLLLSVIAPRARVVHSGTSYSGSLDLSRGKMKVSLSKTFLAYSAGAMMRGENQEPRMGGKTAEISGRGTPEGIAAGTITISDSDSNGEKKLAWKATRGGV